jgi:hypothetical protein
MQLKNKTEVHCQSQLRKSKGDILVVYKGNTLALKRFQKLMFALEQ